MKTTILSFITLFFVLVSCSKDTEYIYNLQLNNTAWSYSNDSISTAITFYDSICVYKIHYKNATEWSTYKYIKHNNLIYFIPSINGMDIIESKILDNNFILLYNKTNRTKYILVKQ